MMLLARNAYLPFRILESLCNSNQLNNFSWMFVKRLFHVVSSVWSSNSCSHDFPFILHHSKQFWIFWWGTDGYGGLMQSWGRGDWVVSGPNCNWSGGCALWGCDISHWLVKVWSSAQFLLLSVLCAKNDLIIFTLNGNRNIDLGCWKSIKKIESMVSCEQSLIVCCTLASIPKFGVQKNSGCFKIYIYIWTSCVL
jgi:hypothetical protein